MKLYKYIGLSTKHGPTACKAILSESKIWLSSFQKLNDPFEGRFKYGEGERDKRRAFVIAAGRSRNGILSMSAAKDDALLWSHYASVHRGICFEFETANDHILSAFREMRYVPTAPTHDDNDPNGSLFFKSESWRYENEYRVIVPESCDKYIKLSPECVTGVYFGVNITFDDVSCFDPLCEQRKIPRFQAEMVKNDYKIGFKPITSISDYSSVARKAALKQLLDNVLSQEKTALLKRVAKGILDKRRKRQLKQE